MAEKEIEKTTICNGGTSLIEGGDGDGGVFLPIGGNFESAWGENIQTLLYFAGLMYFFVGVMLIADVFMSAIERITSKKVRRVNPRTGTAQTVLYWNPTVANLTLMALGSSAPEILLSVIELFSNGMHSGDLGPSTIVGSAAFNLLMIIAVCVVCVPDGESRRIKEVPVFLVTAAFSVFAYLWLLIILVASSADVVEWWEGVLTFLFFPLLCVIAYLADIGFFHKFFNLHHTPRHNRHVFTPESTPHEIHEMLMEVRRKYGDSCEGCEQELLEFEFGPPTSRAMRRVQASRQFTGGKDVAAGQGTSRATLQKRISALPESLPNVQAPVLVTFAHGHYRCYESDPEVHVEVRRKGDLSTTTRINVRTRDGAARAGSDYIAINEILTFAPGEAEKIVAVKIVDDEVPEDTEEFFVDLQLMDDDESRAGLGTSSSTSIIIIDDDHPGVLRFVEDTVTVEESHNDTEILIEVKRNNGTKGTVSCTYFTEDDSAVAGRDYEKVSEASLVFRHGVASAKIPLKIFPKGRHEKTEGFRLVLEGATGGATFDEMTDGGSQTCICTIVIKGSDDNHGVVHGIFNKFSVNQDQLVIGRQDWHQQFVHAMYVGGSLDSEEAGLFISWFFHIMIFPWKFLCACVPPPSLCGGWLCFFCALSVIGIQTAFIGDLATMLGCALDWEGSVTAITIVAIGTSLPDTFASRTAAVHDETADSSIVNVTGSNSVNVFLGLGLPWMIGSIYWAAVGVPDVNDTTDPWVKRGTTRSPPWPKRVFSDHPATFVVPAGGLGTSVAVFSACAAAAIGVILLRRRVLGCELGGPVALKYATSILFVGLWLVYIIVSILTA